MYSTASLNSRFSASEEKFKTPDSTIARMSYLSDFESAVVYFEFIVKIIRRIFECGSKTKGDIMGVTEESPDESLDAFKFDSLADLSCTELPQL